MPDNRVVQSISIADDDPRRADVVALIAEHLGDMHTWSSPESVHALDLDGLVGPRMSFWTARAGRHPDGELLGMVALKAESDGSAELKSMRTTNAARGRGIGRRLLEWVIAEATARGATELLLETGTQDEFLPARQLYASRGFTEIGPFGDYVLDPESVFMRLALPARREHTIV